MEYDGGLSYHPEQDSKLVLEMIMSTIRLTLTNNTTTCLSFLLYDEYNLIKYLVSLPN